MEKGAVKKAANVHQALITAGFKVISEAEAREAGLSINGGKETHIPDEMTRDEFLDQVRDIASAGTSPRGARTLALAGTPPDRVFDQPSKKDLG